MGKKINKSLYHSDVERNWHLVLFLVTGIILPLLIWEFEGNEYIGTSHGHAVIEITGSLFALLTGVLLLKYSQVVDNRYFLFVGLGFLINGSFDFIHGIFSFPFILNEEELLRFKAFSPGMYLSGRIMLASLFIIAVFSNNSFFEKKKLKNENSFIILGTVIISSVLMFILFFSNLSDKVSIDILAAQTFDFILGFLFLVALILFAVDYLKRKNIFTYWLALSLLIGFFSQTALTLSKQEFDICFEIGHFYKVAGYIVPLAGFTLYQFKYLLQTQNPLSKFSELEDVVSVNSEISLHDQLEEYFSRLMQTVESAIMTIWELDVKSDLIAGNNQWKNMFALEKDVTRTEWLNCIYEEDKKGNQTAYEKHLSGEVEYYDHEFRYFNTEINKQIWYRIRGKIIEWDEENKPLKLLGICLEVTESRNKEIRELMEEKKFHNLYDNSPDLHGSVLVATGKLYECNETLLKELGYERHELIGQSIFKLYDDSILPKVKEAFQSFLKTGIVRDEELRLKRKDGSSFDVSLNVNSIRDKDGNILYSTSTWRDITYKKEVDKKLNLLLDELRSSNEELEQFAYVASHDLQEPLRMVASYTELLSRRYGHQLDDDARDFIYYAVDGSKRMKNLIDDLLEYSRVSTRIQPFKMVDLNKLLEEVMLLLKPEIDDKKAEIKIAEMPEIMGSEVQLSRLFSNLISNALKFTITEEVQVDVAVEESKEYFTFSVKDSGIGIEEKYFDKIFQVFQRLNNKKDFSGTGIGLAVCKKIVEKHSGKIWIESEINKGTTFHFTIKRF